MINQKPQPQPEPPHQPDAHSISANPAISSLPPISAEQASPTVQPRAAAVDPGSYCPNCGSKMRESRCKLSCKTCGFFLSCSDFY